MPNTNSDLLTVKEAADYLRIPLPTAYYLVQRGRLPALQIGGRLRIRRSLLDRDVLRKGTKGRLPLILVVIEEPVMQKLCEGCLKQAGFTPTLAGTGMEALEIGSKQVFDVSLIDLQISDIPGSEVCTQLRVQQPELRMVVATSKPDSTSLNEVLRHGPVTFIKKPFELEQLLRALRQNTSGGGGAAPPS